MLRRLRHKWRVNTPRLILILITFALGGSLTGYAGRRLLALLNIDNGVLWFLVYVVIVTILWPIAVLLVSLPLGQFAFFRSYIGKLFARMRVGNRSTVNASSSSSMHRLAIFASGAGSNAARIIERFRHHPSIHVELIVASKATAGVLHIAAKENIASFILDRDKFLKGNAYVDELRAARIDFIVLAGFLWKVPPALIHAYNGRIVNIHPALLPKYGGKGMYGHHVHEAVIAAGESETGITIHHVDEQFDHGSHIYQASIAVLPGDTPETLAARVQALEHEHYPRIIEELLARRGHPVY